MKKIKTAATVFALIMLAGCSRISENAVTENRAAEQTLSETSADSQTPSENKDTDNSDGEKLWDIEGIAMPCENGTVFIISDCGGSYPKLTPISMSSEDSGIFEGLAVGDRIKVKIGLVVETYPGHTMVKSLEKLGGTEDIPEELIKELAEMGYRAAGAETSSENAEKHTQLCMVNGVVYRNTGRTNSALRCGNSDGFFTAVIPESETPDEDGEANFRAENSGYQWGEGNTLEVPIEGEWYIFEPQSGSSVFEPKGDYPRISRRAVERITVISERAEREGKEPIEVPEDIRNDLAMLIEVYEAEPAEDTSGEFAPEGYTVRVYGDKGENVRYLFSEGEKFRAGENYYSFKEKAYAENILGDIISAVRADRVTEEFGEITLEKANVSKETDKKLREDYAAYLSESGREVTADEVHPQYYYGTYNGYMTVVMSCYDAYTDDIKTYKLRYTDEDLSDIYSDIYPYIDVSLPSGSFEMYACKDGKFVPIETAFENGLIEYRAAKIIAEYMDEYYMGNDMCSYSVE